MRPKVIALLVLCLICVISVTAQNKIQIVESKTEADFVIIRSKTEAISLDKKLNIKLVIESPQAFDWAKILLQILDEEDSVMATNVSEKNIERGRQTLRDSLEFTNKKLDIEDVLWHRLQYEITSKDSKLLAKGIISISEITPEMFDLKVVNSKDLFLGMTYRVHVISLHPFTKKPIKNINISGKLELELDVDEDEDELIIEAVGKTNNEGFATLDFVIPKDIKLVDDYVDLLIKGEKNGIKQEAEDYFDISSKSHFYMHTDKPIYQPNQKLYVRGMFLNPLKLPIKDAEFSIEVVDDEEEVIHTETVKTSDFGIVHFEWQIPEDIKLGKYKIQIEDDYDEEYGNVEIKITRYELPNFAVNAKPDKPYYLAKDKTAVINVSADYLFGKPVTNGTVRILRQSDEDDDIEQVEKQATKLDDKGNFSAEFDLTDVHEILKEQNWRYFKDLKFVAYFTDSTTNRTEQKRFDVRLTKDKIHIYFIRYDSNANPNLPYEFFVSTFYADGTPVKTNVTIEGSYRNDKFLDTLAESKTNSFGASKFEIAIPQKPFPDTKDEFNLKITAQDKDGNTGNLAENLYVDEETRQIRIQTNKTIYKPNETIYADIYSSDDSDVVNVDVVNESGIIHSKRVKISKGKGKFRLNYRPDFKGELTLSTYSLSSIEYDFPHHSKTIIFPEANKLNFNIKSLKTVYRPNEEATLNFKVRNESGDDLETALGIIVLDKAIEERAATENTPDNYAGIRKLLGIGNSFGNLNRRDLDNLDLDKIISKDLQLAAEYLLVNKSYKPTGFSSDSYDMTPREIFDKYFKRELQKFNITLNNHYEKTSEFPTDQNSLKEILAKNDIDFDLLQDAWGMPFKFEFIPQKREILLRIKTSSADKKLNTGDDFIAGEIRFERYRKLIAELSDILNKHLEGAVEPPKTEKDLIAVLKKGGVDFDNLKDDWNQNFYIKTNSYERDIQKKITETIGNVGDKNQKIEKTIVAKQTVITYRIRSRGEDKVQNFSGDFDIGILAATLSEEVISDAKTGSSIKQYKTTNSSGAVSGTITDSTGAVIPASTITAKNQNSEETFTVTANENGYFLLKHLPSGMYRVSAYSVGFDASSVSNVVVSSMTRIEVNLRLAVAGSTAVVNVDTSGAVTIDNTDSMITTTYKDADSAANLLSSNSPKFTPRVREYFPETLVWKPEIITDKKGRAEIKFKLADSLTTWKLYVIGSTQTGEIEMFEKELQTFQPFFAELDPPKILTEGDEISLPVPIRNYTKKNQRVSVEMAKNNWSSFLNGGTQQIEIGANSTKNAIFKFRATSPIEDGKQKVTAIAKKEGDAIEKSVKVKPNGKKEVEPQSKFFEKETTFDVNFPAEAFPNTKKAVVKIYPNMLSHVAESVEGLLKRPYGCGEQTTSSTYPNLMILKFADDSESNIDPRLKKKAEGYLQDGYKRLLNYQTDTGFGYWSGSSPDVALTAYVLQFLNDAEEFIEVDKAVIDKAEKWLLSQQKADGSWGGKSSKTTAYVARSLSISAGNDKTKQAALQKAFIYLKTKLSNIEDSYILANLALAAVNVKDFDTANKVFAKLLAEGNLPTKATRTAFYGSGTPAMIETNAIVLQALLNSEKRYENLISKGLQYLLENKDEHGVWYSTQTTVNVLNTLILFQELQKDSKQDVSDKAELFVNGVKIKEFETNNKGLNNPFSINISESLLQTNSIEIKGFTDLAMAQIVATHYIDWILVEEDFSYFDLNVNYNKTNAEIGEEIICKVELQRKRGNYGMILAEIGIPPGADIDRGTLDKIVRDETISRYDVLPDKVVIYAWAGSEQKNFGFSFKLRYGIKAQTSASFVYDYYNEEAKATIAPMRFEVKSN